MLCLKCRSPKHTKADCDYPKSCTCQHRTKPKKKPALDQSV